MMRVEVSAPESPAASANGAVSPSAIPITTSRTNSEAVKCFSTCGVCGILFQVSPSVGIGRSRRLRYTRNMQVTLTPHAEELLRTALARHPEQSPAEILERAL